jgi:predicted TIM-barrel fold metal-dependent hydrolase
MTVDLHQHMWTEPLLDALAARRELPFIRREHGVSILHLSGESPCVVEPDSPARRAAIAGAEGLDRVVISPSCPLGFESLAREQAAALVDAHLEGVLALGQPYAAWGALALDGAVADDVDRLLDRGCVGLALPAGALARIPDLAALAPILRRLEERGAPLFVHPGPGPRRRRGECHLADPLWWPALTDYVADMQAAWLAFVAEGRRAHPRLRVVFAMLAGGAPLQGERVLARGGPALLDVRDPLCFYDTSSYGPRAIGAIASIVDHRQLVYGSDRPVIDPPFAVARAAAADLAEATARALAIEVLS